MSKDSFDTDWSALGLPVEPVAVFHLAITSHKIETCVPVLDEKPKRTAEDRRQYMNAYQRKRRKTDEFRAARRAYNAIKRAANPKPSKTLPTPEEIEAKRLAHLEYVKNYKRMKRAAERVNPERSHSYTQADSDKTKRIAGKPNSRRSA